MKATPVWKAYAPPRLLVPALVADVELTEPEQTVTITPPYRAVRLLARVHGRPVSYIDIHSDTPLTLDHKDIVAALDPAAAERILVHLRNDLLAAGVSAARAHADLHELLAEAHRAQVPCQHAILPRRPRVTVVVCTRDRAHSIGATLASLARQAYQNFEVLVVDNAPSDDTTERLVRGAFPHVRYIREARRGLNHARNRAIAEAHGSIIAYIDDDAIADERWVVSLAAAFDAPDVMCVTGLVAPARLDTPGQELFERLGYSKGFDRLAFSLAAPPPSVPAFPYRGYLGTGCNCAFQRAVFEHVGLFDPHLDMGTPVPGGGDHDMFARIIRAGYTLVYDPGPVVFHDHLADLASVISRLGEYQEAFMAFMAKSILSDREYALPLLGHILYWYARRTIRGVGAAFRKKRPYQLVLSEAIGAWRGPLSLYRARRQAKASAHSSFPGGVVSIIAPAEPFTEK